MVANPFGDRAAELMEAKRGCVAEKTYKTTKARLRRIERDMLRLREEGRVSTMSPAKMSADDIRELILYRKGKNVSASDVNHDIAVMGQLCTMCDNTCVQKCLAKYPGIKPVDKKECRLPPLPESTYKLILSRYNAMDHGDFRAIRPYVMVMMYICTGARNKELRLAEMRDLDLEHWEIWFRHVKGEDTYGDPRPVPIPEEIRPAIQDYLKAREDFLIAHGVHPSTVPALFCSMNGDHGAMSSNTIRKLKTYVERDIGQKFELRDCRRAFGQHYLDNDVEEEDVSNLMGHASTKTTNTYYCRRRITKSINNVKGKW
ncbi:MAG: site-specific integrase [Candidatus Methanomethylophilaceae archaeon]|nr:site-specific integrase [Candidatus Methanomethylophilaceae archaeon]